MEIQYEGCARPLDEIRAELDLLLDEVHGDPELLRRLQAAGLASGDVRGAIELRPGGAGFELDLVVLVLMFRKPFHHVVISLWDDVILPRLKHRLGDDVVGEETGRG